MGIIGMFKGIAQNAKKRREGRRAENEQGAIERKENAKGLVDDAGQMSGATRDAFGSHPVQGQTPAQAAPMQQPMTAQRQPLIDARAEAAPMRDATADAFRPPQVMASGRPGGAAMSSAEFQRSQQAPMQQQDPYGVDVRGMALFDEDEQNRFRQGVRDSFGGRR